MMNHDGLTALHQCAIDGSLEMVSLLLKHGANVNITDNDLWTPLHAAATCGHFKIVTTLIKAGANLTAVNGDGDMPHDITENEISLQYIENEMIKRGITQDTIEEIHQKPHAAMLEDITNIVAAGGDLNQPLDRGETFLHVAIANGFNDIVELLINNGASLTACDEDGWEPIHAAAYWCNEAALDMLMEDKRVNLRTCTTSGVTPYELCDDPELKMKILHKISLTPDMFKPSGEVNHDNFTPVYEEVERIIEQVDEEHIHLDFENPEINAFYNDPNPQKKEYLFIQINEDFDHLRHPSIDDTPPSPLTNLQSIEHSSDRRNSIKEAKIKAPLKRASSDRLTNKEKQKIQSDIESKEIGNTSSFNNIKENIPPNLPPLNLDNAAEDMMQHPNSVPNKINNYSNNNVEYKGIITSNTVVTPQASSATESSQLEQVHLKSKKKMHAPPIPKVSLLELKRQRQETRELQVRTLRENNQVTEKQPMFYAPPSVFQPPPSPTVIRYKYKMVLIDDDNDDTETGFIKKTKCTIM
ncbi:protein phosphatase 1 regulatory subunit 12A isoform X2 [Procambarus clarkii]|nr:protein phosphatase 1 regulatory subunit 12A-like isoform X2 [Procambarus clarkii]XP_045588105.1 protein phosphatase 1 regulatory subunit 12A-like isoform X2 [Procambarus clarkii]